MKRSEYEKKLKELQGELEALKVVDIQEDMVFKRGSFYKGYDKDMIVLCLDPEYSETEFLCVQLSKIYFKKCFGEIKVYKKRLFSKMEKEEIKGSLFF